MTTDWTTTRPVLDADYIRVIGNEAHAQLFPEPKRDGTPVEPRPYGVDYAPAEGIRFEVVFVPERTIHRATGEEAPTVSPTLVRVILADQGEVFKTELEFGKEPTVTATLDDGQESEALHALLRATTGMLT